MIESLPSGPRETAPTNADMLVIETQRLRLRGWREQDRDAFAALNRYADALARHGFGRMLVETRAGDFLGTIGVMPARSGFPPYAEIGWRLRRAAWGFGYAAEAARAALDDAFARAGLHEIIAFTAPDNLRSQAVMARLAMERAPMLDFAMRGDDGAMSLWLTWIARAA